MSPSAQAVQNGSNNVNTTITKNGTTETTITSSSTTIQTSNGTTASNKINTHKITILKDVVSRLETSYRSELGSSSTEFLNSCNTIDPFFDYVAGIRLLQVPHHHSRWDKVLNWAEFFAAHVFRFSEVVGEFAAFSERVAGIIWACLKALLELGRENVTVLEKVFGVFYGCGMNLGLFIRHHERIHQTDDLQIILAHAYTDLLKLVTGISLYYTRKQINATFSSQSFDELFNRNVDSFFIHTDRFTDTIWTTKLQALSKPGDTPFDLIRKFLTPHDRVTRLLTTTRKVRRTRADFTCEWFDRHLAEFLKGGKEVLVVTGRERSGKSFLAEWTVERLSNFAGRRASEVVAYTINSDLKNELTTLSVVKGLLLQLLQLNVTDNDLYEHLAHAYELSKRGSPDVENALWTALQAGLAGSLNHAIVIDSIDQLKGGEAAVTKLLDHLESVVAKQSKTKVLLFSRTLNNAITKKHAHFAITREHTRQDIGYFADFLISSSPALSVLSAEDKPKVTAKLAEIANGSFEWVIQSVDLLKTETTFAAILKKLESLPKTVDGIVAQVISTLDLKQRDTKSLLAWMLASQRPLLVSEIRQLFEIDTTNTTRIPRTTRIEDDITKALGPLITIRDGFVLFANPIFKQVLVEKAASVTDFKNTSAFPFHIQEAHYDLTIRCLAYVKIVLTRPAQPTLSPLNDYELDELFNRFDFLQYATRYWAWHFEASPMHEPTVQHKVTQGFRAAFPHTNMLPIIEGSCYLQQSTYQDALDHHLLTLSIRRMVIGDTSEPVLQTLLNLAVLKEIISKTEEVNEYYYESWKISNTLKITTIATTCAHRYVERTSSIKITTKSTTSTRRSEMLEYIITTYRSSHKSQTEILKYLEILVTLYLTVGETERVTQLRREIYETNVKIYGRSAPQSLQAHDSLITIISSSSTSKTSEVQEITESNYEEASRSLAVTDPKRVELTWSMIDIYTKRNDTRRAEELLVWLWQSWTRHSHSSQKDVKDVKDTKAQQQRIDIALRYVQFLKTHNRTIEAENILRGVATDLEQSDITDEEIIERTKTVGNELTLLGSFAAARGVFSSLWAYYVKTGKMDTAEAKEVSTQLDKTTKHSSVEGTSTSEVATTRQIFDSMIANSTSKTIETRVVRTSTALVESYYIEQRWSEVVTISTVTLTKLWTGWISTEVRTPLPSTFFDETITLIRRLYTSYLKLRHIEQAESTIKRLFYGVISTSTASDELLISTSKEFTDFYESHGYFEKLVIVHQDFYTELEKRKGKTHTLVIKTLYSLGDTSRRINHTKNAEFAYRTIYTNLGTEICHHDASRAAQTLITIYEQQRQYENARKIYKSVWQMFIKHGKEYELKPHWSEDLYEKYVRNLKQDQKIEYETLRQLSIEYRKALVRFYGLAHETTIKATIQLAEINEEKTENREEAITMYEEAEKQSREASKDSVSQSILAIITSKRKNLPHLYSNSSLSASTRAIPIYEQEWQTYLIKHGYSHRDSLKWLSLLVIAYAKQNSPESKTKAINYTQKSAIDILKSEKDSQRLWDSGSRLANIYIQSGLKTEGETLLQQLRSQIIFGNSSLSQSLGLTSTTNLDRRTWIFLVSFQTTLRGTRKEYTTTMADLINEVFLYDSYCHTLSHKAPFLDSLASGCRLLQFMRDINDETAHWRVEKELLQFFSANLSASKTINASILQEFFEIVLLEIHGRELDISILKAGINTTMSYFDKGRHVEANDMAFLVDRFQGFVGGYGNLERFGYGLKLALTVAGYKKNKTVMDSKLKAVMNELASKIAKQLINETKEKRVLLTEVGLKELSDLSGLLGELGNLEDLEYILTILWSSRATQPSWPASTVVSLGQRLVSVQYTLKHHTAAIALCDDMCYNLRHVWGALDPTTLEMHNLLSSFYTSSSQYRRSMQIHEDILRDTVSSDKNEDISRSEAAGIAVKHLELLKRAYQRNGKWDREQQSYVDLYQQLAHIFGSEEAWKSAGMVSLEKWATGTKGIDELGVWKGVESWEWVGEEGKRIHANFLRRSLGAGWGLTLNLNGGRLMRSYSQRSVVVK